MTEALSGHRDKRPWSDNSVALLKMLVLAVVVLQRFALGDSKTPLQLIVVLVLIGVGMRGGSLQLHRERLVLYAVAAAVLLLLVALDLALGRAISLRSLSLLLATYCIGVVSAPSLQRRDREAVLDFFIKLMSVLASVGLTDGVLQLLGIQHQDYLSKLVPPALLVSGYNTGNPVTYGSQLIRTNGLLFLEPSFFSFFLGLAVVVSLYLRKPARVIVLLLAAIVPTLAGSALVVILPALLAMVATGRGSLLRPLWLPAAFVLLLALLSPVGNLFIARITEVNGGSNSTSLRVVEPYTVLLPAIGDNAETLLLGHGPGAADRLVADQGVVGLLAPTLPKLFYEYGILGGFAFLVFLLYAFCCNPRSSPWLLGVLLSYFVLNAALLQSTFALASLLFLPLLGTSEPRKVGLTRSSC